MDEQESSKEIQANITNIYIYIYVCKKIFIYIYIYSNHREPTEFGGFVRVERWFDQKACKLRATAALG